jgi:hypothetical protein
VVAPALSAAKLLAEQVLASARANGFDVSPQQLARWHRAGLLPRPVQRSLGRGRGTVVEYDAKTAGQLVALCKIRTEVRSLGRAGFQLWWQGYDVDEQVYREPIQQAAAELIAEIAGERPPAGRAGKGRRPLISKAMEDRLIGDLRAALSDAEHAGPPSVPWALPASGGLPTTGELANLIGDALAHALSGFDIVVAIQEASIDDLSTARDRAKSLLSMISTSARLLGWLFGRRGAVFEAAARMVEDLQPGDLPGLVVAQLIVQRVIPADFFDLIADPTQVPAIVQDLERVELLRRSVPGASEVLTPAAVRALNRGKEASRRHGERIAAFVAEHDAEIRAILSLN